MKLKAVAKSDSNTLNTQCGKQPSWLRIDGAGNLAFTTLEAPSTVITTPVNAYEWFPCDDISLVKAATTATISVAAITRET